MTFGRIAGLVGVALLTMIANVAASVLYMVIYGHVIDPGHEPQYYNDHIQVAGPYCSIVAGIPILFLAGWWVAGWRQGKLGVKAALIVWLAYTVIDLAILLAERITMRDGILVAISIATKLAAAWCGGWVRMRRQPVPNEGTC